MEYSPLESEMRRESAVIEREARADMQADLDRMRSKVAKYEQALSTLRQDVKLLEAVIASYEAMERQANIEE